MKETTKSGFLRRILAAALSVQLVASATVPVSAANGAGTKTFSADGVTYEVTTAAGEGTPGTVTLKKGTISAAEYSVPAEVTDSSDSSKYTVTAIGESSLAGDPEGINSLQKLTIPASVELIGARALCDQTKLNTVEFTGESALTRIGEKAFDSTGLKTITLPNKVTTVGDNAFHYCRELTAVTLPDSLTSLGAGAFGGAGKLAEIMLPAALTTIGDKPFEECASLKSINVAPENATYASEDGVLFDKAKTKLIAYPLAKTATEYAVPESVVSIEPYAMKKVKNLIDLTLPDDLLTIGRGSFQNVASLETVAFGSKLQNIGFMAFYQCTNLGAVTLPASVTTIEGYAFGDCNSATFTVPTEEIKTKLTSAGASADAITVQAPAVSDEFVVGGVTYKVTGENTVQVGNGVDFMKDITGTVEIPRTVSNGAKTYNVTAVADKAFWRAEGMTALTLPDTITTIGESAVATTGISTAVIPNSVTTLGKNAYAYNNNLTQLTLSNKLTEIPEGAFNGGRFNTLTVPEGVTAIGTKSFYSCTNLQTVSLPATLKTIGEEAFWSNEALRTVTLASGSALESVGAKAFAFDETLKEINLPDTLKTISDNAFAHCKSLSKIGLTANNQLIAMGDSAFSYSSIDTFHYSATLTTVGKRPLDNCNRLTAITVDSSNPAFTSKDGVLFNKDGTTLVQYPAKKKGATYNIPAGCTTVEGYAFQGCSRLTEVTMADGVAALKNAVFKDCTVLTRVEMADSVTTLDRLCFYTCPALEEIVLPAGLTTMVNYVVYDCESLTSIVIPENVTTLEKDAFGNCPNLENIEITSSVLTSVAKGAFNGISNVAKFTVPTEEVKQLLVNSGITAEKITVKSGAIDPTPAGGEFTVDQVDYKILTQPSGSANGTVAVGNGKNGIKASGIVTIPETVKSSDGKTYTVVSVSENALVKSTVTELRLPKTVKTLENNCMKDAPELLKFEIPSGVETIGSNAIADCAKLKSVSYAPNSSLTTLGDGAIAGNGVLETVELPNTLTNIGRFSLFWNNILREVTFEEGSTWTELPEGTFMRGFKLETINGLPQLTKVGKDAFYGCEKLKSIDLTKVTEIGEQAFYDCTSLNNVTLSDQLTTLESGTFFGCTGLTNINLGNGLTTLGSTEAGGEETPKGVFQDCTGLKQIELPASVRVVGRDCFKGCTGLEEIKIYSPELTTIGANAFYNLSPDVKIYVVSQEMKNYLVKTALLDSESVIVMGDVPQPPANDELKLEAMGKGGIGLIAKATAVKKAGWFMVQITSPSGANSVYTVPVPASGELPISYSEGCSVTVWLTENMPDLSSAQPNAGGATLGVAKL